jgi:hypothetical protein
MQIVAQDAQLGLHLSQVNLGAGCLIALGTQGIAGLNMGLQAWPHGGTGCQCTCGGTG